jgi:regulator of cell morphogenesis and NO signaling
LHGSSQTASNLDTNAISRLMAGHAHGEGLSLMAAMEVLTKGFVPPQGACTAVQALYAALAELRIDLTKHAALENDVLFPRAQARLRG